MKIAETLRGALRRIAGTGARQKRRTQSLPSLLQPYWARPEALPKATQANLRRFAETPIARKAINIVKDRVAGMRWRIQPQNGRSLPEVPGARERIRILSDNLDSPNPEDSFRSFAEQVLEDVIVGGFGAIEVQLTGNHERPLLLWPVDGASIMVRADWDGRPDSPRYEQATGKMGKKATVPLNDDELIYIRLNSRTHTPFGLGRLEVAFETINNFLSAHRYAARLASNSVVQYALWLQGLTPAHHERLIRWWQDEIEGTGRVPILSVDAKPEVLRFGGGTDADLRLQWQEFLLRIIADAFDLPPFLLGVEHDVNRSTAGELSDQAFRTAIVPTARLFAEQLSRGAIQKRLGWGDLEFVFTDVDARNEMEDVQIQEILLRNGVLTVNEARAMRGLPPL
ncbi:MAG TPA: phage portal protein [Terriglobales bacterium]|nr:phage portal protein [Terriglobales bacterium]